MKIACLIPDRNDRPLMLNNCLRMLHSQTIKPDIIEIVNDKPLNDKCDITWRYRNGYDRLRNKGIDVIFLIENDDWYSPNYIETCLNAWIKDDKPDLFGQTYTLYYHIKLFSYFFMHHQQRSSAMNTLIKPDLNFEWGNDDDPYCDSWLWYKIKNKKLFTPENHICLGIKHGVGMLGGQSHIDHLDRYQNYNSENKFTKSYNDKSHDFLKSIMDKESLNFYINYFTNNLQKSPQL